MISRRGVAETICASDTADELRQFIAVVATGRKYEFQAGSPESAMDLTVYEFRPAQTSASMIQLAFSQGFSQITVELAGGARWEWMFSNNRTYDRDLDDLKQLTEAVITQGFKQSVWGDDDHAARTKTYVKCQNGKVFKSSVTNMGHTMFRRTRKRETVYASW